MRENAYFEDLRFKEKNSAETYLFHHYSDSLDYGCTVFQLSKLPFFCHIEFIVNAPQGGHHLGGHHGSERASLQHPERVCTARLHRL